MSKLKAGPAGEVSAIQHTLTPVLDAAKQTYQLEWVKVGGFTIKISVA